MQSRTEAEGLGGIAAAGQQLLRDWLARQK